jgi:alkanesulfonate monooxygenase SsuD/methylene tetrahydromethanopterin reductase-like flavin-dependent oxidoreductase (luciferase family)
MSSDFPAPTDPSPGGPPWAGVGLVLPSVDATGHGTPVRAAAVAAESAGLDHVWVPDHLVHRRPVLEAALTLAHVAGATERITLGFGTFTPALRPLTWAAKQLATLAVLAPGRVLLGVGDGGGHEPDFRAARVDGTKRGALLDEALELLPELLSGALVDHAGLQIVECDGIAPVPDVMPPVLVGGRTEEALARVARFADAHLCAWMGPDEVAAAVAAVAALAAQEGRHTPGAALLAHVNIADDPVRARDEAAAYMERRFGVPFDRVASSTITGRAEDVAARLVAYADAGIEGVCLAPAHPAPLEQIEAIARVRALLVDAGA